MMFSAILKRRDRSLSATAIKLYTKNRYTNDMPKIIAVHGRQPKLGIAELESLFGADKIQPLPSGTSILSDVDPQDFPMNRLGGTMKAAAHLAELPFTDWNKIENYLLTELPKLAAKLSEGKIRLGLSVYGFNLNPRKLNATGLNLKKAVKAAGRSVRVVPNNSAELNTAQVIHNQLTGPTGFEIILINNGNHTILGQTFAVQDIEAYAARDQARPKRDARVGMLPPKLAQIIINLAVGQLEDGSWKMEDGKTPNPKGQIESPVASRQSLDTRDKGQEIASLTTVLDPFCGTGVVLQEALLMNYKVRGTDLEPRMIEYSDINLKWLSENWRLEVGSWKLEVGDATDYQWDFSKFQNLNSKIYIACETYLGQPFSAEPSPEKLRQVMQDVDTIHRKFLQNVAKQTKPGFRMCIAVPAWKTKNGFKHLKVLDSLEELGYNQVSFAHVSSRDLLYFRDDQIVARELVVLIRK